MSFLDQIPNHKKTLEAKRLNVVGELMNVQQQLGAQDEAAEWADHECDCDYCPSREFENFKALDDEEIEELEQKRDELTALRDDYDHTIKSLDNYAAMWGKKVAA